MTAPLIWPSTAVTVSASAISRITWLNPTPHRLTVYASAAPLPVAPATLVTRRLATPYLGGTFPRWIALASSQRTAASSESAVWEVVNVYIPWEGGFEHACLKSVDSSAGTMTLATSVIEDKTRFVPES
jgi:hypothetical protein